MKQQRVWRSAAAVLPTLLAGAPAAGQGQATVTAIVRTVKTSAAREGRWQDARLGAGLDAGDRLRTGRRSRAGMRFRDGSAMRVDELSEVVVAAGARDLTLNQGGLYGSFRGPATVSGGYAVAAVRGTEVEFRRRGRAIVVRCYSGSVYVLGGGDARAGGADSGTETTLVDDALIGDRRSWVGAAIRIMSGPDAGQSRTITAFDPATGTITFERPVSGAISSGTDYLLTTQPDLPVVTLTRGQETTVREGEPPTRPRPTFPRAFAGGHEQPWFEEIVEGVATEVYAGTPAQQGEQAREQALDEAVERTGGLQERFGEVGVLTGSSRNGGSAEIVIPTPGQTPTGGGAEIVIPTPTDGGAARVRRLGQARGVRASAVSAPLSLLAMGATAPGPFRHAVAGRTGLVWETEPYAYTGDDGSAFGSRSRLRAMRGRTMASVGARWGRFDGRNETDLYEAFLLYRTQKWGDLKVGRQYLFLGPASNSDLGKLIGFNTIDGAFWVRPPGRGVGWQLGYVYDSAPLLGDGFSGWLGRAHGRLGAGTWGATLLTANRAGGGLGASADLSIPLLPGRLEGYLEAGRDPFDNHLFTGGFHLPGLHQSARLGAFLEYQSRGGFDDRVSLRLRSEFTTGLLLFGQVSKELGGRTVGGVGVQYRWQW